MVNSKEFKQQYQWAKESLIGKAFVNKKSGKIYYVKGITIDTETLELRVIYNDGIVVENDWDRPLTLFLEKFNLKQLGGK